MLASVLRSPKATQINIEIMCEFVALRKFLMSHQELSARIEELEARYDQQFKTVFGAIRMCVVPAPETVTEVGIHKTSDRQK